MDIDISKFKRYFNIRPDIFNDYKPQRTEEDNRLLIDMQEAMKKTSKMCFNKCVDTQSPDFSKTEEKCIQNCTTSLIGNIEHLMLRHDKQNNQLQE